MQGVRHQRVGVTVAETVIGVEQSHQLPVLEPGVRANDGVRCVIGFPYVFSIDGKYDAGPFTGLAWPAADFFGVVIGSSR